MCRKDYNIKSCWCGSTHLIKVGAKKFCAVCGLNYTWQQGEYLRENLNQLLNKLNMANREYQHCVDNGAADEERKQWMFYILDLERKIRKCKIDLEKLEG